MALPVARQELEQYHRFADRQLIETVSSAIATSLQSVVRGKLLLVVCIATSVLDVRRRYRTVTGREAEPEGHCPLTPPIVH